MKKSDQNAISGWAYAHIGRRGEPFLRRPTQISTSQGVEDEIFSLFRGASEIKERGMRLLDSPAAKLSAQELETLYLEFQAYIRQAYEFYQVARDLPTRSRALPAYYAFMNLAKAALCRLSPRRILECVGDSESEPSPLRHGLITKPPSARFADESVEVRGGIFSNLYAALSANPIQNKLTLKLSDLLGHITDLSYEHDQVGKAQCTATFGKVRWLKLEKPRYFSFTLALFNPRMLQSNSDTWARFHKVFRKAVLSDEERHLIFGIDQITSKNWELFATEIELPAEQKTFPQEIKNVLSNYCSFHPFPADCDFTFHRPFGQKGEYPWDEFFSIYALFFYLGSRIRYQPRTIESALTTEDGWIVDQFSRSCLSTGLRHFVPVVLGEHIIVTNR